MKILLTAINAKYIHTNPAVRLLKKYAERENDCEIKIAEFTINNYVDDILRGINAENPDAVGFSCYIWNISIVKRLCALLKIIRPEVKLFLGGPEVSYSINNVFSDCEADYILYGEGERSFASFAAFLSGKRELKSVRGLAYRNGGEIVINEPETPIDMAELPFPYDDLAETENRIVYYEASRGCPFSCRYCLSSLEKGVRTAPIEKVRRELSLFIEARVPQVKFVDRTFNCKKLFAEDIISFLIENDNGVTNFHFEVAADLLDDELTELLGSARNGLFQLEIGVQSTNTATLEAVHRTNDFGHISRCVEKLKSYGNMKLHLDLIAGLPLENIDSFKKSFNDVHALRPDQLQLGFLKVLKGSGMEKFAPAYGIKSSPFPPYEVLETDCLSYNDIIVLKGVEEMTELFWNSGRFASSVAFMLGKAASPFGFYRSMAEFMRETGSEAILTSKLLPYRFLLDYSRHIGLDTERLKWLIRYDMLMNEHTRFIPEWLEISFDRQNEEQLFRATLQNGTLSRLFPECLEAELRQLSKQVHIESFPVDPRTNETKDTILLFNYHKKYIKNCAQVCQIWI